MSKENHYQVIVIGSGPAGLTAAIYASRANLKVLVLEGLNSGGQLMITTDVENYPGFPEGIMGPDLMVAWREQAERFGSVLKQIDATQIDIKGGSPFRVTTDEMEYFGDALILATGASARWLGIESEQALMGYGVSACATCDGFFFQGKDLAVIGGGDTAMEEAGFLTRYANKVYIIHRRDELRASKIMGDRAIKNEKIDFIWDSVVEEVIGTKEEGVSGLRLKNLKTNEESVLEVQGMFLGIGHTPNSDLVKDFIDMDENGYIKADPGSTKTNIDGIFAAGDVRDHVYRQAVTAAGSGCMAAIDAERWLEARESAE
ncbi:thioredoxin-disulfide reductase [bacterium]|nr:thioredoxin-disulfide reductase [bacterium]